MIVFVFPFYYNNNTSLLFSYYNIIIPGYSLAPAQMSRHSNRHLGILGNSMSRHVARHLGMLADVWPAAAAMRCCAARVSCRQRARAHRMRCELARSRTCSRQTIAMYARIQVIYTHTVGEVYGSLGVCACVSMARDLALKKIKRLNAHAFH